MLVGKTKPAPKNWNTIIADNLLSESENLKYGELSATLKIHDGRIVQIKYSKTFNTVEK